MNKKQIGVIIARWAIERRIFLGQDSIDALAKEIVKQEGLAVEELAKKLNLELTNKTH